MSKRRGHCDKLSEWILHWQVGPLRANEEHSSHFHTCEVLQTGVLPMNL